MFICCSPSFLLHAAIFPCYLAAHILGVQRMTERYFLFKVAKAQLHAYDVLLKHIDDKDFRYAWSSYHFYDQNSLSFSVKGFSALISKIIAMTTVEEEVKSLKHHDDEINKRFFFSPSSKCELCRLSVLRYNDLVSAAHDRQRRLIEAVDLAERLSEGIVPLESWLYQVSSLISGMMSVATFHALEEIRVFLRNNMDEIFSRNNLDEILKFSKMSSCKTNVILDLDFSQCLEESVSNHFQKAQFSGFAGTWFCHSFGMPDGIWI